MCEKVKIIHRITTPIAKGIVYTHDIFYDSEDGRQESYILKIAPDRHIHIDVAMPDHGNFGMQEPSKMALTAIPKNGTLLAAVNADFFNMTTGVPQGIVVKAGVVLKEDMPANTRFFGILKSGRYLIGSRADFDQYRNDLYAAVGGRDLLVDDGRIPFPILEPIQNRHPRTAVGYDKSGNLYFVVVDGRNPGIAQGMYLARFGAYLKSLGIIRALNLDGGGSSTFLLRLPGQNHISLINTPSDGAERICANALAISTLYPTDGICHQVYLSPHQAYVLPGVHLKFSAIGLDDSGTACSLPANIRYIITKGSGTISETGDYIAPDIDSDEVIALMSDNILLGSTTVSVRIPTKLTVEPLCVLPANTKHVINVSASYHSISLVSNNACFNYESTGSGCTVDACGALTTGALGHNAEIHISLKKHPRISTVQNILVAHKPILLDCFDHVLPQAVNAEATLFVPFDFSARHGHSVLCLRSTCSLFGFSQSYSVPTMPSAIGIWVRKEKGELPHATLIVQSGNHSSTPSTFVAGIPSDSVWTYMEAPVLGLHQQEEAQITIRIQFDTDTLRCYIDSLRAVFEYSNEEVHLPFVQRVSYRKKNDEGLIKITAYLGEDHYAPYEAPIDYKRTRVILDNVEMSGLPGKYGINKGNGSILLHNIFVSPGKHRFRVCVFDLMNNQNWYDDIFDTNNLDR